MPSNGTTPVILVDKFLMHWLYFRYSKHLYLDIRSTSLVLFSCIQRFASFNISQALLCLKKKKKKKEGSVEELQVSILVRHYHVSKKKKSLVEALGTEVLSPGLQCSISQT